MFLMNVESLMPGLQNLWSEVKLFLLSEETLPVLLISFSKTSLTVYKLRISLSCIFEQLG